MHVSRPQLTKLFSEANVALHWLLWQQPTPAQFWAEWNQWVVPLERLEVLPADLGYFDGLVDWFYELAELAGFEPIPRCIVPSRRHTILVSQEEPLA